MNKPLTFWVSLLFALSLSVSLSPLRAQSLGNAGTVTGTVVDPSGAAVPGATVTAHNPVTGYTQTVASNATGNFRLVNLPPNAYHVQVTASGFASFGQDVSIRTSLPIELSVKLSLAATGTTVQVESTGQDLVVKRFLPRMSMWTATKCSKFLPLIRRTA